MSSLRKTDEQDPVTKLEFEARLSAEAERRSATPALLFAVSEAGHLLSASDAWFAKLGYSRDEVLGRRFADLLKPDRRERAADQISPEFHRFERCDNARGQMIRKDGGVIDVLLSATPAQDFAGQRITLGVLTDVTALAETSRQLAEANRRLQALAQQDELTGLADKQAFEEGLTAEYQRARRDDYSIAVLIIDIDGFQAFNKCFGRARGDHCLKLVAGAIGKTVRQRRDIAARHSDDKFAIILPSAQEAGAMSVAARIQQAVLNLAIECANDDKAVLTISIGVATTWPATSTEVQESVVQDAVRALRQAKTQGRNTVVFASPADAELGAAA